MGQDRDVRVWLQQGYEKAEKNQSELGRVLGIKRQRMSRLLGGEGSLTDKQLIRLLKFLKRLGCVLVALAGLTQAPDSGATGGTSRHGEHTTTMLDRGINSLSTHCACS
jgi:hypothetical protein